jgi:hypothetical protein
MWLPLTCAAEIARSAIFRAEHLVVTEEPRTFTHVPTSSTDRSIIIRIGLVME